MITEISISNYKSVKDQKFSLGSVNLFVGAPGSGKTNIIEALGIAAAAHDDALDYDSLVKRGITVEKPSLMTNRNTACDEIQVAWFEKSSWKKAKLACENMDDLKAPWTDISWNDPEYIKKINNLITFIGDGTIEGEYPFKDEAKNATLNAAFRGSRNFRDYLIYNINLDALQDRANVSDKQPLGIFGEGITKLLSKFTEEQLQEIKSYDYLSWTGDTPPDAENLSVLFFLSLFIMGRRTPATFAIDNIDALIKPDLCCKLVNSIAQQTVKQNKQILITTSNPSIAKGLDIQDPEQKLFIVKLNNDGNTVVEELKDGTKIEL